MFASVKLVRASQIRVVLGASVKDTFPHARQVGFDDHYIPCDVAINWISDNLVLCFMHAVIGKLACSIFFSRSISHVHRLRIHAGGFVCSFFEICLLTIYESANPKNLCLLDVSPGRDNDERLKSHWTNWCGTVALDKEVRVPPTRYSQIL